MAKSSFSSLLPLIIFFLALGVAGAIGFVAYTVAREVAGNTQKKMEKKNITFTRDGMKVGVKEVTREQQEDSTQSLIVKVWNNASFPAYKSRLGWGQPKKGDQKTSSPATTSAVGTEKRKPFARSTSSQGVKKE